MNILDGSRLDEKVFERILTLHDEGRRNDREEIRRRLAMGVDHDEYDRPGRKPSLQSRLQSGMNLQICFMNETASDTESPSDIEANNANNSKRRHKRGNESSAAEPLTLSRRTKSVQSVQQKQKGPTRPSSLPLKEADRHAPSAKVDFFECQARLQTEARMALAQAKQVAHLQMEADRHKRDKSPITEMLRRSLHKAGVELAEDRRRVSRQMLTDINVAQLQVIVNELHTQIERLNETLVELLIARDELHMGQDSMLVDIEDLTRHLGAKDLKSAPLPTDASQDEKKDAGRPSRTSSSIRAAMKK